MTEPQWFSQWYSLCYTPGECSLYVRVLGISYVFTEFFGLKCAFQMGCSCQQKDKACSEKPLFYNVEAIVLFTVVYLVAKPLT